MLVGVFLASYLLSVDNGFCVPHWCPSSACEFDYLGIMGSFPFLGKKPASHLSQLLKPDGWQSRQTSSQAYKRAREWLLPDFVAAAPGPEPV